MADQRELRSAQWFGDTGRNGFIHRSWMKAQGFPDELFRDRPVIGIANSASELTPCNVHLSRVAESVKRGVWQAGGFPLEFPTMSLGETLMRPTTMLFRNLLAMEVEETLRANPLDAVVLLSGCDKTTPAMLMGAASVDLPTLVVTGGPMLNGRFQGRAIGSGTAVWQMSEDVRAGRMSADEFLLAESCMSRSNGHCMTMGTASTMASLTEALGVSLPGTAAWPAVDARRYVLAHRAGQRAVAMVDEDLRLSRVLTRGAFDNAIRLNAAIGGSTNAIVHLLALAGRVGVPLSLDDFETVAEGVPLLVDLMPSGRLLMEDLAEAGGIPAVLKEIAHLLDRDAVTVTGRSLVDESAEATSRRADAEAVRSFAEPLAPHARTVVLRGNLCPDGAVLKESAASPALLRHRGRALVFDSVEDYYARVDDPELDVDETCVLVVRNAGPAGLSRHARGRQRRAPAARHRPWRHRHGAHLRRADERHRLRHGRAACRARGSCRWTARARARRRCHRARRARSPAAPRRRRGRARRRRAAWTSPKPAADRGWVRLYVEHVLQADRGVDLDFLVGGSGDAVPRQSH
jgi:dihydroxy-acid dehydratase